MQYFVANIKIFYKKLDNIKNVEYIIYSNKNNITYNNNKVKKGAKKMTNAELKQKIKESSIKMWEVAERVGVSDITLARWLRSEKNIQKQPLVLKVFNELQVEKEV